MIDENGNPTDGLHRLKSVPVKGRCIVFRCTNLSIKCRRYCHSCKQRLYRYRHPVSSAYHKLKCKAKQRGIPFELTMPEFKSIVAESGVDLSVEAKVGKEYRQYPSFDRVDNDLGYVYGNVMITTVSWNNHKRNRVANIPYFKDMELCAIEGQHKDFNRKTKEVKNDPDGDFPF